MPERRPVSGWALGQKYFALGLKFAGGVIVFIAMGYGLDHWIGTTPLFTVAGTLLGAALSFVSVYRDVEGEKGEQAKGRKGEP